MMRERPRASRVDPAVIGECEDKGVLTNQVVRQDTRDKLLAFFKSTNNEPVSVTELEKAIGVPKRRISYTAKHFYNTFEYEINLDRGGHDSIRTLVCVKPSLTRFW